MELSIVGAGTALKPHCGPTNHRLRLHLPLLVPEGDTAMRVGGEARPWVEGVVSVLDDSFEHEVWNRGERARVLLLVDVWHPELTEEARRTRNRE